VTIAEDLSEVDTAERSRAVRDLARTRKERDAAIKEAERLHVQVTELTAKLGVLEVVDSHRSDPPKWMAGKARKSEQMMVAIASDWHLDQRTNLDEMRGANAYNRQIALLRVEAWASNVCKLRELLPANWQGIVTPFLGDMFPGDLHEELRRGNEAHTVASVEFWCDYIVAALLVIADAWGKVHVPAVVGNHGRLTVKPIFQGRATSNVDWLVMRMVARQLKHDKRITFDIPVSMETQFKVYGTIFQCYHGETNGGKGIGGIWPPIMRLDANKRSRQDAVGEPYHHMILGHWHQLTFGRGFTINGSLVGFDEYAYGNSFTPEPPQQAFLVVHPEHGITLRGPVHVLDRKKEGW
jgi:hypothetical protein